MSDEVEQGRDDLRTFESTQPDNFWRAAPHLRRVVGHWAGEKTSSTLAVGLERFGASCAGSIDRAARKSNEAANLPVLDRYSPQGDRIEVVDNHPSFHEAGRGIYGSGMMKHLGQHGGNLPALTLFYLSSHVGEAGHNCPLACTAGLIKSLRFAGSEALGERYLPRLLSADYDELAHGAQFLTEIQGGSDVGSNSLRAEADAEPGCWRLYGEKWFCSNVTADLALLTARPGSAIGGTRGLGLFLMPRRLPDGGLNHFTIRRLKEKLGTRTLATAEVDFNGALAWNVGPIDEGFRHVMAYVINTSRIFNAVGCAGMAHRAWLIGRGYAKARSAFGTPIAAYPMVQEILADMASETVAMTSGTLYVAHTLDRVERGQADEVDSGYLRMALNLNKPRTAQSSHEVIVSGIELLAGNGTVETFSVLPRLLRDNVVYENWEGSHNVLYLQVLRDCRRKRIHEPFFARLRAQSARFPALIPAIDAADADLRTAMDGDEALATLRMRELGNRMAWLQWAAAMAEDGTDRSLMAHFVARRLGPASPRDRGYLERIAALSGADW